MNLRTLYGIGRNYPEHAKELGNPVPQDLVVFLKPLGSVLASGQPLILPSISRRVDHEVEIVVRLGRGGQRIPVGKAYACIDAVAIGIDVTARDLQQTAKEKGLPWAIAKGMPGFACIGNWIPRPERQAFDSVSFQLSVNDRVRQAGRAEQMLFPIDRLISRLSESFALEVGDAIFTGTPAGVGPISNGDVLKAEWAPSGQATLFETRAVDEAL